MRLSTHEFAPSRDGNPAAESNKSDARRSIHYLAKAGGNHDARDPDDRGNSQSRDDMAGPRY
jgi:hypothetical protein